MSGKRITDEQVKFYMSSRKQPRTQAQASAKAGISERRARRIEHGGLGESTHRERHWRTRSDPFAGVWEEEIASRLGIPTKVTGHSGDRDRLETRGGAGRLSVDAAVTIGQVAWVVGAR
jgi:hypothetical protein